ncbi:MAG: hypothetical protein HY815_18490 [Candidatus Riflebacteria bacterium]|nr:hypothetical protein [Candidatus Riflebacteria bacterium]
MKSLFVVTLLLLAAPAAADDFGAGRYLERVDQFMARHMFDRAAESYKIALMRDPDNQEAWEKHKMAIGRIKAVDRYLEKATRLKREGRFLEAQEAAKAAVKLDPKDREVWKVYESLVNHDPHYVMIADEQDAWDAYREAKTLYQNGDAYGAKQYLDEVVKFTADPHLKYLAKSYQQKVQLKLKERYPATSLNVTEN